MDEETLQLPPLSRRRPQKERQPAVILYDGDEIGDAARIEAAEPARGHRAEQLRRDDGGGAQRVPRRHAPGDQEPELVAASAPRRSRGVGILR